MGCSVGRGRRRRQWRNHGAAALFATIVVVAFQGALRGWSLMTRAIVGQIEMIAGEQLRLTAWRKRLYGGVICSVQS